MNLPNYSWTVLFLIVVAESECGLVDGIYGTVKNTASGLKQDASNVWSFSKRLVGLDNKNNEDFRTEEEKRGLIGGMIHSTREKVHSVRNYFWNTDEYNNDAGLFGNMYNRVKTRLMKVRGFILEDKQIDGQTTPPPSEKVQVIKDALNKLFFGNGTRKVHGNAFQEAIEKLRRKVHEIHSNMTVSTTMAPVHDGDGLIDVRTQARNVEENDNDNNGSIKNNIYDTVDDSINAVSDKTAKTYQDIKLTGDKSKNEISKGINDLKDKISDAVTSAKENEMLGNTNLNVNAKNISDKVKDTLEEVERLSY